MRLLRQMTSRRRGYLALCLVTAGCRATATSTDVPEQGSSARAAATEPARDARDARDPKAAQPPLDEESIDAILAAEDRTEADREADTRRRPRDFLRFATIVPGMKVMEIGAGGGYTAELLARAVGPEGAVYGQNSPFVLERFAEKPWSERLSKPAMQGVIRVDRPFDDPIAPSTPPLDLIVNVLFYHDFGWMAVDRGAHLRHAFEGLAPGGHYVVIDASAQAGHGDEDGESLHRIEESLVRSEFEAAGFVLVDSDDAWRNPNDTRDWNAPPWRNDREEFSDKFALKFQRPLEPAP